MSGFNGGGASVPVGTIAAQPASIPAGWLECDGSAISRADYAALFNEIGTAYGVGDGATTFNLPDLRGEFIRGLDNGRGVDAGRSLGSTQADELKSHSHTQNIRMDCGSGDRAGMAGSPTTTTTQMYLQNTGGSETRPRNVAMYMCIKY